MFAGILDCGLGIPFAPAAAVFLAAITMRLYFRDSRLSLIVLERCSEIAKPKK
jgi:hypothetical protein